MTRLFRSLRVRLAVFFTLGVASTVFVFALATLYHLKEELIVEKASLEHPQQPDFVLHGSLDSDAEIREIMEDLILKTLVYVGPMILVVLALGWFLAKRSLQPIAELNRQLGEIDAQNLQAKLSLREADGEYREHVDNLNHLLARLAQSFDDIREYAAKVAHELRTPLTILRLKFENPENEIPPDLREEISAELERLNHVVDQSLLIARAERGTLRWESQHFDLAAVLGDIVEDFKMLASEDHRTLNLSTPGPTLVRSDPRYVKQILQGYLTNAVVHGKGDIDVSLTNSTTTATLAIANGVPQGNTPSTETLGLGLRVVDALVAAQDQLTATAGIDGDAFNARLVIPLAPSS